MNREDINEIYPKKTIFTPRKSVSTKKGVIVPQRFKLTYIGCIVIENSTLEECIDRKNLEIFKNKRSEILLKIKKQEEI